MVHPHDIPELVDYHLMWQRTRTQFLSTSLLHVAPDLLLSLQLQATIHAQLVTGTYKGDPTLHLWDTFMVEYRRKKLRKMGAIHCEVILVTVAHFERHLQPVSLSQITTEFIDTFITRRSADRGQKRGTTVAAVPSTKTCGT
jgi:hypothetical protein